ncbi:MAG: hypothetical protein VB115_04820 [Christensenellaceae bacterium]|nr:hypothetical protein [Christensenellaceae bacterium]
MVDIEAIFEKVAKEFGMSVDELREELQAPIAEVFREPIAPESKRVARLLAHPDGAPPTPKEFFTAMYEAVQRSREKSQK